MPQDVTSESAWVKGCEFLNEYARTRELGKTEDHVPTCDVYGNEIPSSFEPVTPNPYLPITKKVIYPSYPDYDEELFCQTSAASRFPVCLLLVLQLKPTYFLMLF